MELEGDFRSTYPIFKGCYGDSFLYSDVDLGQLRQCWIHLSPYQSEIPAPLAPSYLQAKQPKATKWSPTWAVTLNPAVESPKTKHCGSKGGHHCSLGHSSNTSTLKCLTLLQPRSLPVPRSQPQMNRTSLPGVMAHTSVAVLPPCPLSQSDAKEKRSTQKTPMHSTPPFPSAPVGLMASTV